MNYSAFFLLLISLTGLSGIILMLVNLLDIFKASAKEKIIVIKMGFITIIISVMIYLASQFTLSKQILVSIPIQLISAPLTIATQNYHPLQLNSLDWLSYISLIYLLGLMINMGILLRSYVKATRLLSSAKMINILGAAVRLSTNIQSPLSFGFFKPSIYLPYDSEKKWTTREMEISLVHEKIHIDRHDLQWKLISLLIRAILFFSPWSYTLHKRFELEIETYCDSETCQKSFSSKQEYGNLLLTMVSNKIQSNVFTNMADSSLKMRFIAMKSHSSPRPIVTVISMILLLAVGSVVSAMTVASKYKSHSFNIQSAFYIDNKLLATPSVITYTDQSTSIVLEDNNKKYYFNFHLVVDSRSNLNTNNAIVIKFNTDFKIGNTISHSNSLISVLPNQVGSLRFITESDHIYEIRVRAKQFS